MKYHVKRHTVCQPQDPSYRLIALTREQNAIVDAADYKWLDQWNWFASWSAHTRSYYAKRNGPNRNIIRMSREILGCEPDKQVDHKNHDTLDNRRNNLRQATCSQNITNGRLRSHNTSGFIGVCFHKRAHKWVARIHVHGTQIHIGIFSDATEAAHARDEAAKKYYGEFAHLNFPSPANMKAAAQSP